MIDNNINTMEVSEKIGRLYSEMIFVNGYVHCDPHPGNVLVQKVGSEAQIILLDHGLYTVSGFCYYYLNECFASDSLHIALFMNVLMIM